LESGENIPADLVIIAAGVRSNRYLARMAGLDVNQGVIVDQHLRTSDPDIYAAGDLAEHLGTLYGTWAPSQYQGTIAGMNASGDDAIFAGIPRSNSIKVLGTDLLSIG
jgi:nitrite reductase (NADH) large subunit